MTEEQKGENKQINLDYSLNPLILYTDFIFMNTNEDGLTLDICQRIGLSNQLKVVSRVGVSRKFAKKFTNNMGKLIAMSEGQIQTGNKN